MMVSAILLSGCTSVDSTIEKADAYAQEKLASIAVPFEWFKHDKSKTNEKVDSWGNIPALALPVKDLSEKQLVAYQKMFADLEKELVNREAMEQFASNSNTSREAFPFFATLASSEDVFGDAVRSVYSEPHQYVSSLTVTGIGVRQVGEKTEQVVTVSMNSVNDTEKFLTHDFVFFLDAKNNIVDVELNQEMRRINTVKPLTKDSEWVEGVHKELQFMWKDFASFPQQEDWKAVDKGVFKSWVAEQGIEGEGSADILYEWYRMNEGDLTRGKITGYLHTDHSALAETHYEVTYPHKNTDKTTSFTLVYDRGLNKIIGLKTDSPFKYKGE